VGGMKKVRTNNSNILRNIPNVLTISRVLIAFIVVYLVFIKIDMRITVAVFAVGALTDFLDGIIARKYNLKSEFGRKADMLADRFLWVGTALSFLIAYGITMQLDFVHYLLWIFIMSREIITFPFAVVAFVNGGKPFPHTRFIAKLTTFIQGFALPSLMLSIYYPMFIYPSWILSIAVLAIGFRSALYYLNDINIQER
jgi:phosphatidylglycerophosphate synthase